MPFDRQDLAVKSLTDTRAKIKSIALLCLTLSATVYARDGYSDAEYVVKNQLCQAGETVEQYMDRKLKSSHRDLGWRVFALDDGFDVERSFLVSKGMELRYRWRVNASGAVQAMTDRAQELCS